MSIETIIPDLIEKYKDNYFCQDELDPDKDVDPFATVVPTTDNFFGTFACNFLVFTKIYLNDDSEFDDIGAKQKLISSFEKFARYELHFYIDAASDDIQTADSGQVDDFESMLQDLAEEMKAYNVTYDGKLGETQLKESIQAKIDAFNLICKSTD